MLTTRESLRQELERLNSEQMRQVADFIAFIKFRARRISLPEEQSQLRALYSEFAKEDKQLAEQGLDEYAELLKKEDLKGIEMK